MKRVLAHFDYVGVLTIEFFVRRALSVANEMAPRVHNSGHWTIEGAMTSQFENHVRAILGLPLGDTAARAHSAMINLLDGCRLLALLKEKSLFLHDYGKEPRPPGSWSLHADSAHAADRDRRAASLLRRLDSRKIPG